MLLGGILLLMLIVPVWAQTQAPAPNAGGLPVDSPARQYLLGDWGGARTELAQKGIAFDFFYISDSQGNPVGGLQQSATTWERVHGRIDIDFSRFTRWQGLKFHASGLWQTGANLGARMGALANPSDLVNANATRLDTFWVEQRLFGDKLRIRVGEWAGKDFYGNQEYGDSWLMDPLGYAFGNLFSSVYESPNLAGTPGAEVKVVPRRSFYLKTAVTAGNRNPLQQDPTGFEFKIRNNPDFLSEFGYLISPEDDTTKSKRPRSRKSYPGVYKFGGVYNNGQFSNPAGSKSHGNYLVYGIASQALFRTKAGSNRGIDATVGFDWAPGDLTRENTQITAGARFNAPFRKREEDWLAWGFVHTKISDAFSQFGQMLGGPLLGSEKAFELNYSLRVRPYLLLQPAFQYYVNVGGNPLLSNPAVFGLRTKITL